MQSKNSRIPIVVLCLVSLCVVGALSCGGGSDASAEEDGENPIATYYDGPEGYPAWTDRISWGRVIDMSTYDEGGTDFEKFENARDELADAGGGVLYYPAGTYDFTDAPMDGPDGRGLMLPDGVVIQGEAPSGKPNAFDDGDLELPTKFKFGFKKVQGGDVPRDWAVVGLKPADGQRLEDVNDVGICWVELIGGVIYFGPDVDWAPTWGQASSWKTNLLVGGWRNRRTDGTHPFAPYVAGGKEYVGAGDGRIVFGCKLTDSAVNMSHMEYGDYPHRWAARLAAYGSRVFIANNCLPKSDRVFKYQHHGMTQIYDYGKTIGIDVNKSLLGLVRDEGRCPGYYEPGVVVRDNWVYNHGNKGYEISGSWVTIRNCHNERDYLRSGSSDAYGIGGWVLTLDGKSEAGGASDNMSRGYDLSGGPLWIHECTLNNTGSHPGNDGEGILCQRHGGTEIYSWAITHSRHDKGKGESGYFGGYDVDCFGLLIGWNKTPGWVGNVKAGDQFDCTFIPNQASSVNVAPWHRYAGKVNGQNTGDRPAVKDVLTDPPSGRPSAPKDVRISTDEPDAPKITWTDTTDAELGFRVERRIGEGEWFTIAYRPRQSRGHDRNPPAWVDFTAPRGVPLSYRVVALNARDEGPASDATEQVTVE
ncbi:MAG: hypothetical protein ACLFVW_08280 [Phycisphaerae bacterium]